MNDDNIQKIKYKNSSDLYLSANLRHNTYNEIVIMCHGFMSSKYSIGRYERLSKGLFKVGYSTCAFDFAGCGKSDDDMVTAKNHLRDLSDTISYVRTMGYDKIYLFGHSFGSLICLMVDQEPISGMVLTGALLGPMHYHWPDYFSEAQLKEIETQGYTYENRNGLGRKRIQFNQETLDNFENIDAQNILQKIKCPLLIIHGDGEQEEVDLYQNTVLRQKHLKNDYKVLLVEGADHTFLEHYDFVIDQTCDWFKKKCV